MIEFLAICFVLFVAAFAIALAIWLGTILWYVVTLRWGDAGRLFLKLFEILGDADGSDSGGSTGGGSGGYVAGYVVQYTKRGIAGWVSDSSVFSTVSTATSVCQQRKNSFPDRSYRVAEVDGYGVARSTVYSL